MQADLKYVFTICKYTIKWKIIYKNNFFFGIPKIY